MGYRCIKLDYFMGIAAYIHLSFSFKKVGRIRDYLK